MSISIEETPIIRDMRRTARELGITNAVMRAYTYGRLEEGDRRDLGDALEYLGVVPEVLALLTPGEPDPRD